MHSSQQSWATRKARRCFNEVKKRAAEGAAGAGGDGAGDGDGAGEERPRREPKLSPEIKEQLDQWREAKRAKDFTTADRIREELRAKGIEPDSLREEG